MLTYTEERQRAEFKKHARASLRQLRRWMKDNEDLILEEAEARMFGIGFEQYGDQSWFLTFLQLSKGRLEEIADAVVYGVIALARGWRL